MKFFNRYRIFVLAVGVFSLIVSIVLSIISNPFSMILNPLEGVKNKTISIVAVIFYIITFFGISLFLQEVRDNSKNTRIINKRRTFSEKLLFVFVFFVFVVYTIIFLYILLWAFLSSLKENREFFRSTFAFPEKWLFSNYKEAFSILKYNNVGLSGMIFNTLYFTIAGTLISLFFNFSIAFLFAKYKFIGRNFLVGLIIATMTIPIVGTIAPFYKLIYSMHLNDSYLYVIVNAGFGGGTLLIAMSYFKGLSSDYINAAEIDGAGNFRILFSVAFPLSKPLFFALFITNVISGWNDYMTGLLYLDKLPTIALGLYYYREELQWVSNEPYYFAGVFISLLPALLIFCIFANKIMDNVVMGGLKG